jgi:4-hydroxy-tetrahydrodipicolinate reductase
MSAPIPVSIHGFTGRMGQALVRAAAERDDVRVVASLDRDGNEVPAATRDSKPLPAVRVLIDFSHADAFDRALDHALSGRIAFVSGTTGLDRSQRAKLERAGATIPVLWSANFSLGVAVLTRLVREAARALPDWQCEILEAHHRHKRDAPSGTALALGRAVAEARDIDFDAVARTDRNGARSTHDIGIASLRAGDTVGEHSVWFAATGERIELAHRATDRDIFARGALAAAAWLAGQKPGIHTLDGLLGR